MLRDSVFGPMHDFVSCAIIDKGKDDEMRKQGPDFHGVALCTIQEAPDIDIDEAVWRTWVAGEGWKCRLPHAVHTPLLRWDTTAKFIELNTRKLPTFASIGEWSDQRRMRGAEKDQIFTASDEAVDARKKHF